MTREEITRMALESGFTLKELPDGSMGLREYVYAFAMKVAAAEREACAAACEVIARDWWKYPAKGKNQAQLCVEAIRERSKE